MVFYSSSYISEFTCAFLRTVLSARFNDKGSPNNSNVHVCVTKQRSSIMSYINEENQEGRYGQLARKLVKIASISGSKVVLRHAGQPSDTATELLHELGTTDVAIGDVTAEVMITTLGKIPNEMYYLEDTTAVASLATRKMELQGTSPIARAMGATVETYKGNDQESSGHSSILIALLTALLIILLLCCITACFVAKSKRKSSFFGKGDMECEPGCTGISQPLLNKISSTTNKTSIGSLRN